MSTPVLNNGIFLRDTTYNAQSDVDSYHLLDMLRDSQPMDMGMIDLWAMTQKVEMPLYQMSSFGGKNTIMVDNERGEWKWSTPVTQDLPYVIEDIEPANTTKGIEGQTFRIKLSTTQRFGHGDIITYDKFNGLELYIVPDVDIFPMGRDACIYTVQLVNNDSGAFLDNKYLKNGTKFFRVSSAKGEYGERKAKLSVRSGHREFYNYVGMAEAHAEYSVTSRARMMTDGYLNKNGTVPVVEIWRNFDQSYNDPSITNIEQLAQAMGKPNAQAAMKDGMLQRSFLTRLEAAHISKVAKDIETYLMWGKGGRVRQDGPDDVRLSVGLWKQLDSSFKRVYNKANFSLEMFRAELYNFYAGKVDFTGPDPNRDIVVQTGIGGMKMVNEAIANQASNSGLVIQAATDSGVGAVTGKGMNLGFGFAYTSYVIPFLANVHFVINPAFDNLHTNNIENPLVDGYPLSSYNFIVFDITDNTNDNIYLLKLGWDNELKWLYRNGDCDYMGRTKGFQSSGRFAGYEVEFAQRHQAIWVKDPTKVLKIVMKNPITGGSF